MNENFTEKIKIFGNEDYVNSKGVLNRRGDS